MAPAISTRSGPAAAISERLGSNVAASAGRSDTATQRTTVNALGVDGGRPRCRLHVHVIVGYWPLKARIRRQCFRSSGSVRLTARRFQDHFEIGQSTGAIPRQSLACLAIPASVVGNSAPLSGCPEDPGDHDQIAGTSEVRDEDYPRQFTCARLPVCAVGLSG